MATGGRILHHLRRRLPEPSTTVLWRGSGRRRESRALFDGARDVRIHGELVPVRAWVVAIDGLSAHGDCDDLLRWARGFDAPRATRGGARRAAAGRYLRRHAPRRARMGRAGRTDGAAVPLLDD
jgi:Cft2 family RNA processing exonuclease